MFTRSVIIVTFLLYCGEAVRNLPTRINEHQISICNCNPNNAISSHVLNYNHSINFSNVPLVYHCNNFARRRILESAFISVNKSTCMNNNLGFMPLNINLSRMLINSVT